MSTSNLSDAEFGVAYRPRLLDLARRVRSAARDALCRAVQDGTLERLGRPHSIGAGDITFGIDVPAEAAVDRWFEEQARLAPLSLLTEDAGWRHRVPDGRGGVREIDGFDHGGPRIAVDPIDGTRNLMTDLRSAWTVLGACGPGRNEPRLRDVTIGVLAEIPDSRAAQARVIHALRGQGARLELVDLASESIVRASELATDHDDRPDHGYFPFFRYMADLRPDIARVEAEFFLRLGEHEGADVRTCYDDQYISNGGQLALLALGRYRFIADLRHFLAARRGRPTLTGKPYDVSGAILCAREAGAIVTSPDGSELDFPLDVTTPIGFVGYANAPTHARLARHLAASLVQA